MKIDILDDNNLISKKNISDIRQNVKEILNYLKLSEKTELCISFVDDEIMRKLNKDYKKIDKTTDVLSFTQDGHLLGDIVISLPTAKRNAKRYKSTAADEVKRLLIHGVLHLTGFDHKIKKEREIMREKENELFENVGRLDTQL